jgi:hypothetical protein
VDVTEFGRAHHGQPLFFSALLEMLGHQLVDDFLPDFLGITLANQIRGRFAGTEAGKPNLLAEGLDRPRGFVLDLDRGDAEFE